MVLPVADDRLKPVWSLFVELLIFAVRFLALSQALLLLTSFSLSKNPPQVRLSGALIFIGVIGYLLGTVFESINIEIAASLFLLASLTPLFIVIFVWLAFEEQAIIPNWAWILMPVYIATEAYAHYQFGSTGEHLFLSKVLQVIGILLTLFALCILWNGRDEDLVETRTKLRLWAIGGIALLTFLILFLRLVTAHLVPEGLVLFTALAILTLTFSINIAILKMNPSAQMVMHGKPQLADTQDPHIDSLLDRMQSERLYADHDLRVAKLADLIGLPEHSLRKKINKQLGYRNFNQFVNRYRIEEAGQRLHQEPSIPVLSVALDVGFRSISSFNTAFQNQFGMSPTEFRRQLS